MTHRRKSRPDNCKNDPWEILIIALFYFIPGVAMLFKRQPFIFPSFGSRVVVIKIWSPIEIHIFGWLAVTVSILLIAVYFYIKWSLTRESTNKRHFLDI